MCAMTLVGCAPLPQGVLLPDLPPSEKGTERGPLSASHGAEGRSSASGGFVWGSTENQGKTSALLERLPRSTIAEAGREGVTLNLIDAPIADAAKAVLGDVLKVNYIVDSRVKGSVTVQTSKPIKREAVLDIFDAVLSAQGARVVVVDDLYKIAWGHVLEGIKALALGEATIVQDAEGNVIGVEWPTEDGCIESVSWADD